MKPQQPHWTAFTLSRPRAIVLLLMAWMGLAQDATAQHFELQATPQVQRQQLMWSDGSYGITATSLALQSRLGYAVLRMRSTSPLRLLLPPTSSFAPLAGTLDMNVALIPINSMEELDRLAPLAHEETGQCGSLEFLANDYRLASSIDFASPTFSSRAYFSELESLLSLVSLASIDQHLNQITSFSSRFHSDTVGKTAGTMIADLWRQQLQGSGRWQITEFPHTRTEQKSVIARLEGQDPTAETIILGAHLDSIALEGSRLAALAPGADDDASGLSILTEILRLIERQQLTFHRSIELQAYAAEEVGLIGSKDIAKTYRDKGIKLAGMLQYDMAYYSSEPKKGIIHLLEDYSSRDLRRSAIDWIRQYMGPVYTLGKLPSGSASDHKAWWEQGYATLFPFEDPQEYNHKIHTPQDTRAGFDEGLLIQRMTQLGLLFVAYQAGLSSLSPSYQSQIAALQAPGLSEKLYLAIEREVDSNYYFSVSAPLQATTLEFCQINAAADLHCTVERLHLSRADEIASRKIFFSEKSLPLAAGQKWRVMAYDQLDQMLAWRQIELGE